MKFKRLAALLTAMILILLFTVTAFAAPSNIIFQGGAEKFVFFPGSYYTDTDMFQNFKDMMPGDIREQHFEVKNTYRGCDYVRIYMWAQLHDAENEQPQFKDPVGIEWNEARQKHMEDFLLQFDLTLKEEDTGRVLFEGKAGELAQLEPQIVLGDYRYNQGTKLVSTLEMDINAGNEFQYDIGEVDWCFAVEEFNDPAPTGDSANLWVWAVVAVTAFIAAMVLGFYERKVKRR